MSLSIIITTFSKRYHFLENLINQIRQNVDFPISVLINGEKDKKLGDEYLQKTLNLFSKHSQIYPIYFQEVRGLSKLWNTGIIHSANDKILILNDDIEINNKNIFHIANQIIDQNIKGIIKVNNSFSHFFIDKKEIEQIGFFDEKLLGFGEEDGDITYRYLKQKYQILNINCDGIKNIISEIRHDEIKQGVGKYSLFNRHYVYNEKYITDLNNGIQGMFDEPKKEINEFENQYKNEIYFRQNKEKLFK